MKINKTLSEEEVKTTNEFFSKADMRQLSACEDLDAQMCNLSTYTTIFKDWYASSLIAKTFVLYEQSIERIIYLYEKLKGHGIINPYTRLHAKSLFELQKLITTDSDWNEFCKFWNERRKELTLETILRKYRVARKLGQVLLYKD